MKKVTIIPVDSLVVVDGEPVCGIDMDGVDENIHAIQFDGESGHIEFNDMSPNIEISSILGFQWLLNLHQEGIKKKNDPFYGLSDEEILEKARGAKREEVKIAAAGAMQSTITVNGVDYPLDPYKTAIRDAHIKAGEYSKAETLTIEDAKNQIISLSLQNAKEVSIAVDKAVMAIIAKRANKLKQVELAGIEGLQSISWDASK